MIIKKLRIMALVLGVAATGFSTAATLSPGNYTMTIRETPEIISGSGVADVGCDSIGICANSSYTTGAFPGTSSHLMLDNGTAVAGHGGIGSNGNAGVIDFSVNSAGVLSFSNISIDAILGTFLGVFAQHSNPFSWTGTIDSTGNMSFIPTGRQVAVSSIPALSGDWNIDDFNNPGSTDWVSFTTGTMTGSQGDITGQVLDGAGHAVFVSTGAFGSNFGTAEGVSYYEVWSVDISPSAVPVPAAIWLFVSGLVGLIGMVRQRTPS
jgi:hypothetical protein